MKELWARFIQDVRSTFAGLLTAAGHSILAGFEALFVSIEQNGGQILVDVATSAVAAAEQAGGPGSAKLAAAQTSVLAVLEKEGIPVVMNAVNGAIEAAVAKQNADKAAAVAAQPAATGADTVTATAGQTAS